MGFRISQYLGYGLQNLRILSSQQDLTESKSFDELLTVSVLKWSNIKFAGVEIR